MSSLPARMKKIQLKMKVLEFSQDSSHYKSMGIFPDAQWQLSLLSDLVKFRTRSRLYGCPPYLQNKEDPIKNRGARVFTTLYINFSDAQGRITLDLVAVSGRNLNSSKL